MDINISSLFYQCAANINLKVKGFLRFTKQLFFRDSFSLEISFLRSDPWL